MPRLDHHKNSWLYHHHSSPWWWYLRPHKEGTCIAKPEFSPKNLPSQKGKAQASNFFQPRAAKPKTQGRAGLFRYAGLALECPSCALRRKASETFCFHKGGSAPNIKLEHNLFFRMCYEDYWTCFHNHQVLGAGRKPIHHGSGKSPTTKQNPPKKQRMEPLALQGPY